MLSIIFIGDFVIVNWELNFGGFFGIMWLSLFKKLYGIYGINDLSFIGKVVFKGCICMYNV